MSDRNRNSTMYRVELEDCFGLQFKNKMVNSRCRYSMTIVGRLRGDRITSSQIDCSKNSAIGDFPDSGRKWDDLLISFAPIGHGLRFFGGEDDQEVLELVKLKWDRTRRARLVTTLHLEATSSLSIAIRWPNSRTWTTTEESVNQCLISTFAWPSSSDQLPVTQENRFNEDERVNLAQIIQRLLWHGGYGMKVMWRVYYEMKGGKGMQKRSPRNDLKKFKVE